MLSQKKEKSKRVVSIIDENTSFQIVESYNALAVNLSFALPNEKCKKIMITSALPYEGKTTVTVNLAITLAKSGSKVIVVDADLRKPRAHVYFKVKNNVGLSNVLCGLCPLSDAMVKTEYTNLNFIPAGALPPNPAELMASKELKELLILLEEQYDYIIIDTPPVNIVSDALSVSKEVSGTILVARQYKSEHDQIKKTIDSFELANSKLLGFVLNDAHEENVLGYKYRYKYKNRYHYKYYNKDNDKDNNSKKLGYKK